MHLKVALIAIASKQFVLVWVYIQDEDSILPFPTSVGWVHRAPWVEEPQREVAKAKGGVLDPSLNIVLLCGTAHRKTPTFRCF